MMDFLVTPGGFLRAQLPSDLSGKKGWQSSRDDFSTMSIVGSKLLKQAITRRVSEAAKGKCRWLTIGLDLVSEDGGTEAELVALVDLRTGKVLRWTGKSYPTTEQERRLIQIIDLKSHMVKLANQKIGRAHV